MSDDNGGLVIDPAVLADIQAQCRARRAELEAARTLAPATIAPGSTQSAFEALPASPPMSESERFALALETMPPRIRAFFEREESPYIPPHPRESDQDRLERQERASFGGWAGD
jgi:hypothetical protein